MFLTKRAPEIISKKDQWINSEPLTLEKLMGKIVLLDFWTYSCINCLRTLPALKEMWEKYKSKNFIIMGIHTPEFEFEKEIENVKAAVKKHRIEYPVLNDPERINWNRYGNKYWPRYALINPRGNLILEHIGESGYDEIDERIAGELGNKGERIWEKKSIVNLSTNLHKYQTQIVHKKGPRGSTDTSYKLTIPGEQEGLKIIKEISEIVHEK